MPLPDSLLAPLQEDRTPLSGDCSNLFGEPTGADNGGSPWYAFNEVVPPGLETNEVHATENNVPRAESYQRTESEKEALQDCSSLFGPSMGDTGIFGGGHFGGPGGGGDFGELLFSFGKLKIVSRSLSMNTSMKSLLHKFCPTLKKTRSIVLLP